MTVTDVCAAKLGEPYHMHECGEPVVYLTAGERGNPHYREGDDSGQGGR